MDFNFTFTSLCFNSLTRKLFPVEKTGISPKRVILEDMEKIKLQCLDISMEAKLWFDLLLVKSVAPKVPIPQNGQTHSNNSLAIANELFEFV